MYYYRLRERYAVIWYLTKISIGMSDGMGRIGNGVTDEANRVR